MIRVSGVLIGVISGVVSAVIAALVEAFFFFQRVITFGAHGGNWGAGIPKVALMGAIVGAIVGVAIGWLFRPHQPHETQPR
jgi:gas vesicle protein